MIDFAFLCVYFGSFLLVVTAVMLPVEFATSEYFHNCTGINRLEINESCSSKLYTSSNGSRRCGRIIINLIKLLISDINFLFVASASEIPKYFHLKSS